MQASKFPTAVINKDVFANVGNSQGILNQAQMNEDECFAPQMMLRQVANDVGYGQMMLHRRRKRILPSLLQSNLKYAIIYLTQALKALKTQ